MVAVVRKCQEAFVPMLLSPSVVELPTNVSAEATATMMKSVCNAVKVSVSINYNNQIIHSFVSK